MKEYKDEQAGIYLRPMTWEDTDNIVAWRNSDAVRKNFIYQELFTRESHENWIRTMVETGKVVQTIICDLPWVLSTSGISTGIITRRSMGFLSGSLRQGAEESVLRRQN